MLRGVTSNERYVTRAERERLQAVQEPLGRRSATRAFEESSHHVATGLEYLPAVARGARITAATRASRGNS